MSRQNTDRTYDQERTNGDITTLRLTVPEAAEVMEISAEAVRQRIKRGTLPIEKDPSGSVFVLVDETLVGDRTTDSTRPVGDSTPDNTALVESLQGQIEYLKETVARRDEESAELRRIIAGLVQRVPELESASEPREAPETAPEEPSKGTTSPSWWRRFLGLD